MKVKRSLFQHMYFGALSYILCSVIVTTGSILYMLSKYSESQIVQHDQESIRLINNKLDSFFTSVESSEYTMATDNDFFIPLTLYYDVPNYRNTEAAVTWFTNAATTMRDMTLFQTGLEFIVLGKNGPLPIDSTPELVNSAFIPSHASWYHTVVNSPNRSHIFFNNRRTYYLSAKNAVSVIKAVPDIQTGKPLAFIVIDIPYSELWDIISDTRPSIPIEVRDPSGRVLFSNAGRAIRTASRHTLSTRQTSSFTGITVTSYFKKSLFMNEIRKIVLIDLIILVAFLMIVFIALSISTRQLSHQIHVLMKNMSKVVAGNFEVSVPYHGRIMEMDNLYHSFDLLVVGMRELIRSNYEANLLKVQAELDTLQQKINPHFLYNTLETISSQAIIDGSKIASTMCQKLGSLFAYSLQKESLVTLAREINQLQDYLYIAEVSAFTKDVQFHFDIDPLTSMQLIPKMTIQPLVENCLKHAFDRPYKANLHVSIRSRLLNDWVVIEVSDDGRGMSEEQLRTVKQNLNTYDSSSQTGTRPHIGLQHVNARYQIVYGDPFSMNVESVLGKGTRIILNIPIDAAKE